MLIVIEGPSRPWWIAPAVVAAPVVLFFMADSSGLRVGRAAQWAGLACMFVGVCWICTRLAQFEYFKSVARHNDPGKCPVCAYSLRDLKTDVCPECGTDVRAYLARVRRATGSASPNDGRTPD